MELNFYEEKEKWYKETSFLSSLSDIYRNIHYQNIIRMGKSVIPLIFEDMRNEGGMWYEALRQITGTDPIKPEHRGYVEKMNKDWLEWAEKNGYRISQ